MEATSQGSGDETAGSRDNNQIVLIALGEGPQRGHGSSFRENGKFLPSEAASTGSLTTAPQPPQTISGVCRVTASTRAFISVLRSPTKTVSGVTTTVRLSDATTMYWPVFARTMFFLPKTTALPCTRLLLLFEPTFPASAAWVPISSQLQGRRMLQALLVFCMTV